LIAAYTAEIGSDLSEAERGLIKQAAALTMTAERMQADIVTTSPSTATPFRGEGWLKVQRAEVRRDGSILLHIERSPGAPRDPNVNEWDEVAK